MPVEEQITEEGFASVEDLEAAEFEFGEETVEVETKRGTLRLRLRELTVGRRSQLLTGILDKNGNVKNVKEFQCRMFAAACAEPKVSAKQARGFLTDWPATACDTVTNALDKLGGDVKEEESAAEAEFPDE